MAAIFGLGPWEIVIIVVVIVIFFVPAILPRLTRRLVETFNTVRDMAGKHAEQGKPEEKSEGKKPDTGD